MEGSQQKKTKTAPKPKRKVKKDNLRSHQRAIDKLLKEGKCALGVGNAGESPPGVGNGRYNIDTGSCLVLRWYLLTPRHGDHVTAGDAKPRGEVARARPLVVLAGATKDQQHPVAAGRLCGDGGVDDIVEPVASRRGQEPTLAH